MKKADLNNLRAKTKVELEKMANQLRIDVTKANMDLKMRRSKNTNVAKNLRRNLAQILTVISEVKN